MLKKLIAPVQAWLLSMGSCVGCGNPLKNGSTKPSSKIKNSDQVTCKCGRIYIQDSKTKKYRRALLSEI